jgi:cytoskeletal protein CcmA (bactofilin family)
VIFGRKRDEMEGFRRMREALRQQADPQDHALLEEQDQYGPYDEEQVEEEDELEEEEAAEQPALNEYEPYQAEAAPASALAAAAMAPPTAAPRPLAGGPSMTTISADTTWSGTMSSESSIYLEGRVEGTIEARETIFIAEQATIDARLKAHSVVVSGQVAGHLQCAGRLEVTPTGRLTGEVETGSLVVHEGAIIDGKFKMKRGAE